MWKNSSTLRRRQAKYSVSPSVSLDTSATSLLAEVTAINTYKEAAAHKNKNGNLPRKLWEIDGTRSQQYSVGKKLPTPLAPRLFEGWRCWKRVIDRTGTVSFVFAFAPLSEYKGLKRKVHFPGKYEQGTSNGVYVITEIAPRVCSVLRVQHADLNSSLPVPILKSFVKKQTQWATVVQEKFKRNGKEVDVEIRGVLVQRMREGVELEEDQKKVFEELEKLFGGEEEEGWGPLKSPYEGVKMEIKYKQQEKGQRSIVLGKASGVADCTAEEAAAWFFEYCSRERTTKAKGELARLEIREGTERANEKKFATVKKFPFPISNREFVQRLIWRRNNTDCVTVAVQSIDKKVDYGGIGKASKRHNKCNIHNQKHQENQRLSTMQD